MKKFLLKSTLILPIVVFLVICEYKYRAVDNDYRYKNEWLTENASTVQVLSLGSSHGYFGIRPSEFTLKTFNASHVAQDLYYDKFIFDKFYDELTSLEYLILPVSCFSPFYNMETDLEAWRAHFYGLYYDCCKHQSEPLYNVKIFNHIQFKRAVRNLFHPYNDRTCLELGEKDKKYVIHEDLDKSGRTHAQRHSYDVLNWELYDTNRQYAEDMIQCCYDRNIKVILLTTPVYATYRKHIRKEQLDAMLAFCDNLEMKYDNVIHLNFWDDPRFDKDDFADADHLSCDIGGVKLSRILNDCIMSDFNQCSTNFARDLDSIGLLK